MTRSINLALQGGGAHGAFTWGVLDVLLDDPEIEIAGISGTSAGAMNGAALKAGMLAGGRDGARANLDWLWQRMGALDGLDSWLRLFGPEAGAVSQAMAYSLPYMLAETATRVVSPYGWGPLYQNPLRPVAEAFRYDQVCHTDGPDLFICATNVHTGKARVFSGAEITPDAILASACLPTLFQAVEIDGQGYWDGGYTGNPALWPLFNRTLPDDIVIVNINPIERPSTPRTPHDIQNRINEISFNSALMGELRAISFVQRLIARGAIAPGEMKDVKVHMIADDELMRSLSVATKSIPTPLVMEDMRVAGRRAAEDFLTAHKADIGVRATVDLVEMYGA